MKRFKIFIPLAFILLISIFLQVNFSKILEHLTQISFLYAGGVILSLYICNFFLAALRLKFVAKQVSGEDLSYKDSCRTILMGQLGGGIPIFGAFLGQSIYLNKLDHLSYTSGAFITFYDKISMAVIGVFFGVCAGIFLFDLPLWSYFTSQFSLLWLLCVFSLSSFLAVSFGITQKDRNTFKSFITLNNLKNTLVILALGAISWLLSASAFGSAAFLMNHDGDLLSYVLGGFIISVIASLPVSVNGWGIREFGAITIFGLLGLPQDVALLSSISVGFFSYISLFISMFIISFHKSFHEISTPLKKVKSVSNNFQHNFSEQRIIYFLGCATSITIFFQIYFSSQSVTININMADVLACIGILMMMSYKQRVPWFAIPETALYIWGFIVVFFLSLLCGFLKYGYTNFAMINKFMGLFILLGYSALGAAFFYYHGMRGYRVIVRLMSITLITILSANIILIFLVSWGIVPVSFLPSTFMGFAANRNVFALQLLLLAALQIIHLDKLTLWFNNGRFYMASVLLLGVYLTFSRSGIIIGIILVLLLLVLKLISRKNIVQIMVQCCLLFAFLYVVDNLFSILTAINFIMKYLSISFGVVDQSVSISSGVVDRSVSTIFSNTYSGDSSDHERLYSISEGLRLWLHNPLFGGGLGRFMFDELAKNGRPLVIHNTFVWLLAEFGLIGIIPFVLYVWSLFQNLYIRWKNSINIPLTEREKALFLLLVIFGGMSMVHEIFYQRCIWFIAGLLLAKTVQDKKEDFQK